MGAEQTLNSVGSDVLVDLSEVLVDAVEVANYVDWLRTLADTDAEPAISLVVKPGEDFSSSPLSRSVAVWTNGAVAFDSAAQQAAMTGRDLLILNGLLTPTFELLVQLRGALNLDGSFGSAQPRFANTRGHVCALPAGLGDGTSSQPLSGEAMKHLPPITRVTELAAACMLIRCELLCAIEAPSPAGSVLSALRGRLSQSRRLGFCAVVVNGAVFAVSSVVDGDFVDQAGAADQVAYPSRFPDDTDRYAAAFAPDVAVAEPTVARLELLLSAAYPAESSDRRLLVDGRGVFAHNDGASRALLGFLDGLAELDLPDFRIEVHSDQLAADFHGLAGRYPAWSHFHHGIVGPYAAAVAPVAPTSVSTIRDLHQSALVVVPMIRDTVAYDVELASAPQVWEAWSLLARHANGLSFASEFTRSRFVRRFDISNDVMGEVVHPSLAASDYALPECSGLPRSDFLLVFGNEHAHKDLGPTIRTLLDAFPYQRFVVFGAESSPHPRVEWVRNGRVPTEAVHRLFATARAMIYPSFLEGFGFPAIEALAYGTDVFVRSSELWPELLQSSQLPGRLTEFDCTVALVEALGRFLAGHRSDAQTVKPATIESNVVPTWRAHASRMLTLVERCLSTDTAARWIDRNHVMGWTNEHHG